MRCVFLSTVQSIRTISEGTFLLSFSRPDVPFRAGQHIFLSLPGFRIERAYSLYNGEEDAFWRVLIREIPGGTLSPALRRCRPGDSLFVSLPFGDFTLPEVRDSEPEHLFLATGTGIAPFHSMLATWVSLRCRLAHGVRRRADALPGSPLRIPSATICLSGDAANWGEFQGYVSAWLESQPIPTRTRVYLCGRNEMVYSVFRRLVQRGIPTERIGVELYF